jgi:hypothetical protein
MCSPTGAMFDMMNVIRHHYGNYEYIMHHVNFRNVNILNPNANKSPLYI